MTNYEIFISIAVLLLSIIALVDKISNRKNEKREVMCKEHIVKFNTIEKILEKLESEKADNEDVQDLKFEIAGLKADMTTVKGGINRIEQLIMEGKL